MIDQQAQRAQNIPYRPSEPGQSEHAPLPVKERCPIDRFTQFYWTAQGLEYRCRHCKGVQIVTWEEIFRHHQAIVNRTNILS